MRFTEQQIPPEKASAAAFDLEGPARYHDMPFEGGAQLLRLNQSALRRLESIIRAGIKPGSGTVENGGILIGTYTRGNSLVTLLDVVPVETEHSLGCAFRPSGSDFAAFAAAIRKHSVRPRRVIGYFRTSLFCNELLCNALDCDHSRDTSLRPDDKNLLRRCFAPGCLLMLVQPDLSPVGKVRRSTAWCYLWDDHEETRLIESIGLIGTQPAELAQASRSPSPVPIFEAPENEPLAPQPQSRDFRNFMKPSIGAAAGLALAAVFALGWFTGLHRSTAHAPPLLNFKAEAHGPNVDFAWDPASSAIRGSERGALDIVDGSSIRRIDLSQTQLRSGHYAYAASQSDLTCVMTVYRANDAFIGATQYIRLNLPQTALADSLSEAPEPVIAPPPQEQENMTAKPLPAPKNGDSARTPFPAFKPPPAAVSRSAAPPRVEEPPQLSSSGPGPATSAVLAPRLPDAVPPPAKAAVTPVPRAGNASDPAFSPAVPISRVVPKIPAEASSRVLEPITIRFSLLVNKEGRVTLAHPVDRTDLTGAMLATYVQQAALQWRFKPARMNGEPVVSETIVSFKFAPGK